MRASHSVKSASSPEDDWNRGIHFDTGSELGSKLEIDAIIPKGSIYNPNFPAAAEARFSQINRVIDLIYKALAPMLPNDIVAGNSAAFSFAAYSGLKPDGEYWVFLEANEGSYGGRPASDGPDSIDSLTANTRNNPLEDLAVHLPMICDRYELRDDVMPNASSFTRPMSVRRTPRPTSAVSPLSSADAAEPPRAYTPCST